MRHKVSYTAEQIREGVTLYFKVKSYRKAALTSGIPRSTLHGWVSKIGTRIVHGKRKHTLKSNPRFSHLVDAVKDALSRTPCCTAQTILRTTTSVYSTSTVYRAMKAAGYSCKNIHWRRSSTDPDARTKESFINHMRTVDVASWISLDEFSAISTDRPRQGWGKKGQKIYARLAPSRRHKSSGIVAIGAEGILACCVVKGAVNKSIFVDFMSSLSNGSTSIQGRTILMDNIAFHKSKEIIQLCDRIGVDIQFTPPYTP